MVFRIHVSAALRGVPVPPLILQPLVENAVKHGIAPLRDGGEVSIVAELDASFHDATALTITIQDTGLGASLEELRNGRDAGVGLRNVERRLECQYGAAAGLKVTSVPGHGTVVLLRLPIAVTIVSADTLPGGSS